ncbi:MAG: AarF/ABC1/UbiB kinase family protein [Caldilineaceae bacterium]|nr:AarF/ABC1/UbiB kinase family protein [Caldilineaceae bacterium]
MSPPPSGGTTPGETTLTMPRLESSTPAVPGAEPPITDPPTADLAIADRRRYRRILRFFAGIIFHFIIIDLFVGRLPWLGPRIRTGRPARLRRMAQHFRSLAVEMGGVLIKLGQFLSSRVDVLPADITEELAGLQDEVPPVPFPAIMAVLQQELGDITAHFVDFETTPLAAASLGQAHRAHLRNADPALRETATPAAPAAPINVVVKVQRPQIEAVVRTDLAALRVVARWVMRYKPLGRRANVPALMEEFARTLWEELDYRAEAANAERFAALFADEADVAVPQVYHAHSTGRVLTLENVEGIRIDNVAAMNAAGIVPTAVAERLLDIYFKQVFQAGFFHADPHPGNLFVRPLPQLAAAPSTAPTPFQIVFIDFGMMGNIQALMGENLRRLLLAVAKRDAHTLTQIYQDMGFFLPGADLERITEAQAAVLGRIWGRSLQEMARPSRAEIQELGSEFKDLLRTFPFQVPQDFIYLGRAVGMLSGLTSQLHPGVNLWRQMEKYALEIVGDQRMNLLDPKLLLEEARSLLGVPAQVRRLIQLAESGKLQVHVTDDGNTLRRLEQLERRVSRLNTTVVASALLLAGTLLYGQGSSFPAFLFWGIAGLLFITSVLE